MNLNTIKKTLYVSWIPSLFLASYANAASMLQVPVTNITDIGSFLTIACTLAAWIFTFLMVIVVVMLLVSAFYFLTAGDNAQGHAKAKGYFLYAIIGLVVAILPRAIIAIVSSFFGPGPINAC
ncbi:MAG: hypothetical protein A3A97_03865 [Candidatus Terrybacteria bacterium RIFCSPLOWO2_01_FULL_40_23]|uniref:Uncharacterized protein n=1 Tax=Candidatus Terrybacteria bacterium RIFCSPLOWO2_01_FULL_40_23 TaxID=1802366 RepID=A0A1G2PW31_9BACT|nr:MAG: hypothetical protein UT82_C0009G0004 [Parcubacteria group bacterium GW2011_GWB1_40_14]OHA52525.1 MAG: hypothetical protein A3A97_03865 [Candidatus Terrybacteria bacterium RIFCSPLOWO2_01_FULL_40_23]